ELLDKVKAAIYLSLDELWDIPEKTALLATILDPRLKGLRFVNQDERINIQEKLRKKYQELKDNQDNILLATQDNDHKNSFSILSLLACDYLGVPATSVPSERLFSDANVHISARRTRLRPNL
ncbi:16603_t:CDS:2, partial [Cetraspora pellucida]